ncbi:MAG: TRAP transporter large permease [Dehalococcoidia bacterium]|jgi:tripartite ATP-independent transporter DctM subunit
MEPFAVGIIAFIALFALIFLKVPIAFAFAFTGFLGLIYLAGFEPAMSVLTMSIWTGITSYTLMAVPLFILMGLFASHSGIGGGLYNAASKWLGKLPGGLAIATTWGCAGFAACTGSSAAGMLVFGPISYEPMKDAGYSKTLALGTICCGATIGSMIPPSISFIVYGSITDESIGRLFMAGVFPGILEAVLYSITIFLLIYLGIWKGPAGAPSTWKEKLLSLKGVWGMLLLMGLVIGGIYRGIFTPTEASGIGALGAFILLLARKGFNWTLIKSSLFETMRTTSMVFTIIIGSIVFARLMALSGLNMWLLDLIIGWNAPPVVIVIITLLILFLLGFVMPVTSTIVLLVPFLYPIFTTVLGYSGIWFGVLVCVMAEIAVVTPPIGMNLFMMKGLFGKDATMGEIFKGAFPFVLADVVRVVILVAFPAICLWLPGTMYG